MKFCCTSLVRCLRFLVIGFFLLFSGSAFSGGTQSSSKNACEYWRNVNHSPSPSCFLKTSPGPIFAYCFKYWYYGVWDDNCSWLWQDCDAPQVWNADHTQCVLPPPPITDKQQGCPGEPHGNPCDAASGNKYQQEVDYTSINTGLSFTRSYNSGASQVDKGIGYGWIHQSAARLEITASQIMVRQSDGRGETFTNNNGLWQGDADTHLTLTQDSTGYSLKNDQGINERYDLNGHLISKTDLTGKKIQYSYNAKGHLVTVTGGFGHTLNFTYDANNRIQSLTVPGNQTYQYQYDSSGNLVKVVYPDNSFRQYHYENSQYPHALAGISDENGNRYATFGYATNSKAILTQHAQTDNNAPQEKFSLSYDSNTQTTVTDAIGTVEKLTFIEQLGTKHLISSVNQSDNKGTSRSYDAKNNLLSSKDAEGKITTYAYNAANQRIRSTEAAGTSAERVIEYQYLDNNLDLVSHIYNPSVVTGQRKETEFIYNPDHTLQSVTLKGYQPNGAQISRSTAFQYNSFGQVTQIDGSLPGNTDVTTLSYYLCNSGGKCGQLARVTNAVGQAVSYNNYDNHGHVTQVTDALGMVSTYSYDSRSRVISATQTPPSGQGNPRTTKYTYDNAGQTLSLTTPDGIRLNYRYDAAHYLRSITDNQGNHIDYKYDLKGNLTRQDTQDINAGLIHRIKQAYDIRNRLQSINNAGLITQTLHDATGNLTSEIDPKQNPATQHSYDGLNRLQQTLDALGNPTGYQYDVNDQLVKVQATNNAVTTYSYDDLGNLLQEKSPDRGTSRYRYDAAGNRIASTDARGVVTIYRYDLLNRLLSVDYAGTDEDIIYQYDQCAKGTGRLCSIQDQSGVTRYSYDIYGNVVSELKTELGQTYQTGYAYDAGNRLVQIRYPDGRLVNYSRDVLGRVQKISTVADTTFTVADNLTYRADGLLTSLKYGNGIQESRTYDSAGRLSCLQWGSLPKRCYSYDANSNVINLDNAAIQSQYNYDVLDRLVQEGGTQSYANYSYDANSNRLTRSGVTNNSYNYTTNSNRLTAINNQQIQSDAAGNTVSDQQGKRRFEYNQRGQLYKVYYKNSVIAVYTYNALGQRTRKDVQGATIFYHYDLNGLLLSESHAHNTQHVDYIAFDSRPLVQLATQKPPIGGKLRTSEVVYLHTDHLNSPRVGTDALGKVVWNWQSDAFGVSVASSTQGNKFLVNLRFPGQFFDAETGLYYNYHRYYDPQTGRYISSDPIGLSGGVNTYGYVGGNPVRWVDPTGEDAVGAAIGGRIGSWGGGIIGEILDPAGGGIPGSAIGGAIGSAIGNAISNAMASKSDSVHEEDQELLNTTCADASWAIPELEALIAKRYRQYKEAGGGNYNINPRGPGHLKWIRKLEAQLKYLEECSKDCR